MQGRGIGPARESYPNGLVERLLILGLGLLIILGFEFTPFADLRAGRTTGSAPLAAATAVSTTVSPTAPPATEVPTAAVAPPPEEAQAPPSAVEAGAPAAAPARSGPANAPDLRVVADGDGANLRSGPSRSAAVVVSVRDGTVLTNLNQEQTAEGLLWRRVADGDLDGWVAAELLTPVQ